MIRGMTFLVDRDCFGIWLPAMLVLGIVCSSCLTTPPPTPEEKHNQEIEALLDSGTAGELYDRANSAFDSQEYLTAFQLYQAVLDRDPQHLGALVNSGVCARRLGDVDGAIAWYDRALEVDPNDTTALQNRVVAGLLLSRFQDSLPLAKRLAELSPEDNAAWQQLGALHLQLRQFEDAAAALENAVELDSNNPTHHYQLGLAYAATDDYAAASESFNRALHLNPNLREVYAPHVQVLMLTGRYEDAWSWVAEGQTRGAMFDPDLILELQRLSGQVGPR